MADPFTLSLIAANCAWALIQNRTDAAAVAAAKRLADKLRRNRVPANHDILKATHAAFVRSSQLLAKACDDAGADEQDLFAARALLRVANDREFTTFRAETAIPKRELDASIRAIFEGAATDPGRNAVEAVIVGLEQAMGVELTETLRALFRDGSDRHRSWPEAFQLFFAEEVKSNERVFRALEFERTNEILALADAHRVALAGMNAAIAAFRDEVHERIARVDEGVAGIDANVREILNRLSAQDAPVALLRSLAEAFGEARPQAGVVELEAYLRTKIGDYHQLRDRIEAVQHEDNHDAALLADANVAIGAGDFDKADRLLSEAEALLDERVDRLLNRKAERRALRGEAARLKGDYETAVAHFDAAAEMLPATASEARISYQWLSASAVDAWGLEIDPAATQEAVRRWRALAQTIDRATDPETWGRIQNNLGNALGHLGEREQGIEPLEQALAAHQAALAVRPRDRFPIEWAITQDNLGNIYFVLGERENGTETLEKAVTAFRAAMEVCTRDEHPLDWARIQNNLANALGRIGTRREGAAALDEAAAAYRAALDVYTRDRRPFEWAGVHNNLGNVLTELGRRQDETSALDQAVAAYQAALEVYTRDRLPLDWAMTQNNLGSALLSLGRKHHETGALEQATAAFRSAQEIYTRDRLPFHWALTQENLGFVMATMAERLGDCSLAREACAAVEAALEVFRHPDLAWNRVKAERALIAARAIRDELCRGT